MLLRRVVGVLRLLQLRKRLLHHRGQGIQYIGVRKHGESTVNCRRGQEESASELKMSKNERMAGQMLTGLIHFIAADETWRRVLLPKVLLIVLWMRVATAPSS